MNSQTMSGKPFTYEEVNYRLMAYKGTVYKFKIEFSSCGDGKNSMRGVLSPSQSRQIDRTVGVLVQEKFRGTGLTKALQTTDFLIRCSEKPWIVVKKVGFRVRGKELNAYDQMLLLNVAPKQKRLTVVSRDRPNVRSTHSQGERGQGGAAKNGAPLQSSSSQRGHDLEQQTSANQFEMEAQGPKPPSSSRQRCEQSSKQIERVPRLSPNKNLKKSSHNVNLPRQQKIIECLPRQQSPRGSLLQEQLNVQARRSQTTSPRQFYSSAKLSVQERSAKSHPDVSPRIFHGNSRFCQTNAERGLPLESLGKCTTFQTSRMLHKSPRLGSVRSSEGSPPKRREIQDQLVLDPSKRRRCSRSIGPEGDTTVKQPRSDLRASSDVTATERLLHPLDKEFVRREYEQEEMRLVKLAKPSTSSAERRAWLSSS